MASLYNLRKGNRQDLDHHRVAVLFFDTQKSSSFYFVNALNLSIAGVLIESDIDLNNIFNLKLMIKNIELKQWDTFSCQIARVHVPDSSKTYYFGLEFLSSNKKPFESTRGFQNMISPSDIDFILHTRLIKTLPEEGICSFLNCMSRKTINAGTRFITQGDTGDCLYIVQKGLCSIQIQEQNKSFQTIAQRREGDVLGEMALLTGELRTANVISESEMILWQLQREEFDNACKSHPDIREFLTELLTNRLENSAVTGVRNVGRYIMTHRIGHGGWSFVYKGKHKALNMPVAIKMMKHNQAMDDDFLENFRNEGRFIAQLNHPNIVQIYDIEELYRTIFIIMEHLEGESLEDLLERKGALPFSRALVFLEQISSGIAYAHDHQIIHRDIKPGNILILKNDQIKLLDFGLACAPGKKDFELTGTVHYMSPEQIEGDPVDFRSDIYSFGILAYEIFTGQKPFAGDDLMAIMKMHTHTDIPDPTLLVPDLSAAVKNLILKSCAKSPDQRYNSMDEIKDVLLSIIGTLNEKNDIESQNNKEVTVLLISHGKDQGQALNKLLDEFSSKTEEKGFSLNIAGKTQIK